MANRQLQFSEETGISCNNLTRAQLSSSLLDEYFKTLVSFLIPTKERKYLKAAFSQTIISQSNKEGYYSLWFPSNTLFISELFQGYHSILMRLQQFFKSNLTILKRHFRFSYLSLLLITS